MNIDTDLKTPVLVIETDRKLNKVDIVAATDVIQKRVGDDYKVLLLPYGDRLAAVIDNHRGATWCQHPGQQ